MRPVVDGERQWRLESVAVAKDQQGRPAVAFALDDAGGEIMRSLTGDNVGQPMAIVLDGEVISAPTLRSVIGRQAQITGSFTEDQIKQIVERLRAALVRENARQ